MNSDLTLKDKKIGKKSVCEEVRVEVTIWRLGTNIEYRTIAALFGLGRSTACEIVLDTCEVIARHLMPRYVRVPQNESFWEMAFSFNGEQLTERTYPSCGHRRVHQMVTIGKVINLLCCRLLLSVRASLLMLILAGPGKYTMPEFSQILPAIEKVVMAPCFWTGGVSVPLAY